MKPKFLRNRKTGVVFPYNENLAKRNRQMEPCDDNGKSEFEEITVDLSATKAAEQNETIGGDLDGADNGGDNDAEPLMVGDVSLEEATKAQLLEFAEKGFGEKLGSRDTADQMRARVKELLEA